MKPENKETRLVMHTYFQKKEQTTIDDIHVGDLVFIKIWSPLHYGNRELIYYGKIAKITKCFFWITEYTEGFWTSDTYCDTKTIEKRDANPEHYTKQWAKSRLLEVWTVKTKQREDEVTVYSSK